MDDKNTSDFCKLLLDKSIESLEEYEEIINLMNKQNNILLCLFCVSAAINIYLLLELYGN
jgi:hypothetical protein